MVINKWKNYIFQIFLDLFVITVLFFFFQKIQYEESFPKGINSSMYVPSYKQLFILHYKALIIILISWLVISENSKLYKSLLHQKLIISIGKLFYQILIITIIVFAISGLKHHHLFSWNIGIRYVVSLFCILLLGRIIYFFVSRYLKRKGIGVINALVIDENINTNKILKVINERNDIGIRVINFISEENQFDIIDQKLYLKGTLFKEVLIKNNIKQIYISHTGTFSNEILLKIHEVLEEKSIKINYIPSAAYNDMVALNIEYIDTLPIFVTNKYPLDILRNQILKFVLDKIFALVVTIFLLSWLIPIIAILILIDSPGPVFFIQKRNGLNGKTFNCLKFRTMVESKDNSIKATIRDDKRITKLGKFLRKSSLDEIPQFINVLLGDMSIVGPRPHMLTQNEFYGNFIKKYNLRHCVKPGITGLSQIKGYRGAIDSDKDMEDRIRIDLYYIKNWSLLLDIQIIYLTVVLVFKGDKNAF